MGGKSSKSTQKVQVVPDAQTQQMNALALQQAQYLQPFRQQAASQLGNYLNPRFSVAPDILTSMNAGAARSGAAPGLLTSPTTMASLRPYSDLQFSTPEQAAAAGTLMSLADMTTMSDAMKNYFSSVVSPSIAANLQASGMGRGGATAQAESNAATQYTLPLLQQQQGNLANLASYVSNVGQSRMGLAANLADPNSMRFQGGQTQTSTTTTKQPFNFGGLIGSIVSPLAGSFFGPMGSALSGWATGIFGGGSGGSPSWNIPLMTNQFSLG